METRLLIVTLLTLQIVQVNCFNHFSCDHYYFGICTDAKINDIKFYKSNSSEYKKCPDSNSCFASGSEVYLNTSVDNGLYLESYSILNLFHNASLYLNGDSVCKLVGRSLMVILGSVKINSAQISVSTSSEILNYGKIELDESSKFHISTYSVVHVSRKGKFLMGPQSELIMYHSLLALYEQYAKDHSRELIMKDGAKIYMPHIAVLRLLSGGIVLMEKSELCIFNQAYLNIDGYIELAKGGMIDILNQGEIDVGYFEGGGTKGDANSSLIFLPGSDGAGAGISIASKRKLLVRKGAHCFAKTFVSLKNDTILNGSTKTDTFECYFNRNSLDEAVSEYRKNATMSL